MSFLIDTDICSAHLKGVGAVTGRLLQYTGRLHVSGVTVGVRCRIRKPDRKRLEPDAEDLPAEIRSILTMPRMFPKIPAEQELFAEDAAREPRAVEPRAGSIVPVAVLPAPRLRTRRAGRRRAVRRARRWSAVASACRCSILRLAKVPR